ncbi:hypothetical protein [Sphaerisporangium aureirubrum]|uniref:DUF4124 domain-containing protein n=1 Tax=Sphaerisporangium aureirubrum TaxID=1544736 RepID=A0ABW1NEH4_9ACTN
MRYVISVLAAGVLTMTSGVVAAAPSLASGHGHGNGQGTPTNGFSRTGPWNTKLPRHVPLAPNSQAIVNNIKLDKENNYGSWAINTDTYSTPVYYVGRHTPRKRWTFSDCLNLPELAPVIADSLAAVPTPPDMITSMGTDSAVTIYQPSTDTYWDFWRAEKDAAGNWSACWGGKIERYSRNPGIFDNPLGATATGLPMGAFAIRIDELRRGYIDHAVNIATVRTRLDCHSWPATRDDGYVEGADIPCEGQRFRLDPAFDIRTLTSPAARTIARAMQEYGLIMTDKAGALVTYAEDPRLEMARNGGVDPYTKLFDPDDLVPDGSEKYVVLGEIPVERLQALPMDYGKPRR